MSDGPILRAPPPAAPDAFASLDPARLAAARAHGVPAEHLARAAPMLARMRELRVGGDFWAGDAWVPPKGSLEELAASIVSATDYRDPFTSAPSTPEAYVEQLGVWRAALDENRAIACCVGMSAWKRQRMSDFFRAGTQVPVFRRGARGAVRAARARGGGIAVWSTRIPATLERLAAEAEVPLFRVEDGFVRSLGLGSGMLPPASIIIDRAGIYYDPSGPSDLEQVLNASEFGPATLTRARRLIDLLVARDITKYAAGHASVTLPRQEGRRLILVPGQVADDLSVRLGGGVTGGNLDLLARVRRENPDAHIVYRPHPDVDAGHRKGAVADHLALVHADLVQRGGAMSSLIGAVDEIHTLTSLAGFEGLLRGRRVVTYGTPFYAGWGLTQDQDLEVNAVLRRSKKLSIEGLVAGALLVYSRYLDPVTRLRCGPEVLIDRLADRSVWRPGMLMRGRQVQGWLRGKLVRLLQPRPADRRR